ncbi:hypothetical protein HanIR_Chr15g0784931 [Helianthus annuus]|nr:hypothetical protein HanIR_Chr15g0784931 [Helianthus annuus]
MKFLNLIRVYMKLIIKITVILLIFFQIIFSSISNLIFFKFQASHFIFNKYNIPKSKHKTV